MLWLWKQRIPALKAQFAQRERQDGMKHGNNLRCGKIQSVRSLPPPFCLHSGQKVILQNRHFSCIMNHRFNYFVSCSLQSHDACEAKQDGAGFQVNAGTHGSAVHGQALLKWLDTLKEAIHQPVVSFGRRHQARLGSQQCYGCHLSNDRISAAPDQRVQLP